VDSSFPPYLWDLLLPQAELTLNLLWQSALNPQISAWEIFQGPFDFNKSPLGPVGCRVLIHAKPVTRRLWDFHAKEGFYIGPALDSYRCFKLVKSDTKSQVFSDTVEFCHAYRTIPAPTPEDKIIHGLQVMSGALRDAPPPTSISQVDAIANLHDLFESWCLLGPLSTDQARIPSPGRPRVPIQEPPRVTTPSSPTAGTSSLNAWMPPPCPTLSSRLSLPAPTAVQVTLRQITFDNTPPPRLAIEPRPPSFLPPMSPIAHRARSCSNAPLALFAGRRPYQEGVTYHIQTAKSTCAPEEPLGFAGLCQAFSMSPKEANGFAYLCAALEKVDSPSVLSVLDPTTGEFLEHRQL
jgi:hypothetical protein